MTVHILDTEAFQKYTLTAKNLKFLRFHCKTLMLAKFIEISGQLVAKTSYIV